MKMKEIPEGQKLTFDGGKPAGMIYIRRLTSGPTIYRYSPVNGLVQSVRSCLSDALYDAFTWYQNRADC